MRHVFAISAYGESPFLEDCIRSLERQTAPAEVILCTSTPSDYLLKTAGTYGIPMYVREGTPSLCEDWNFCLRTGKDLGADLVTVVHQDDIYLPGYGKEVGERAEEAALIFTAVSNIDGEGRDIPGRAENVKRLLRVPLRTPLKKTGAGKRLSLSFGNSVPCPACTYNLHYVNCSLFSSGLRFAVDWKAFRDLAEGKGSFEYIPLPLVKIRLHEGQETRKVTGEGLREKEERAMLESFHSKPVAALLMRFYRHASEV